MVNPHSTGSNPESANARAIYARSAVDGHPIIGVGSTAIRQEYEALIRNWVYIGVLGDMLRDPEMDIDASVEKHIKACLDRTENV